jgi:trypsin
MVLQHSPPLSRITFSLAALLFSSAACGVEDGAVGEAEDWIVGGYAADAAAYPWFVSIWLDDERNCGGSLITPTRVLTAAHCIPPGIDFVRIGGLEDEERDVINTVEHPTLDAAVLELSSASAHATVDLNLDFGHPAALPLNLATTAKANTFAIGFGRTTEGGNPSNVLLEVQVPAVDNASCNTAYGGITNGDLCAGVAAGGSDTCQGDSGGPLFTRGIGGMLVAGVTSNGLGCARAGFPGIYVRVSELVPFLTTNAPGTRFISPAARIMSLLPPLN